MTIDPKDEETSKHQDDSTQRRKQLEIIDLFGTVDFNPNYDYKKNRRLDRIESEE
jgi:hypothetical protein